MLMDVREQLIEAIHDNVSVVAGPYPVRQVAEEYAELAVWLQALGISNLLLYANAERFFLNLIRSGHTRRAFLRRCREEGVSEYFHLAISRWESFFDAVAADELALAREIVALSPSDWVRDGEYEDDFCYSFFFHQWIAPAGQPDRAALEATLARFERVAADSARFDLCRAIYAADGVQFNQAFRRVLHERDEQLEADRKTSLADNVEFEPRAELFVEGIAVLKIAERAGLPLDHEYPSCPSLARQARHDPPPADMYDDIDRERLTGG